MLTTTSVVKKRREVISEEETKEKEEERAQLKARYTMRYSTHVCKGLFENKSVETERTVERSVFCVHFV